MDSDIWKNFQILTQALKNFIFNRVFFLGLGIGFIFGIIVSSFLGITGNFWNQIINSIVSLIVGIFANSIWDKYKRKKQKEKPYQILSVEPDSISFEAMAKYTPANLAAFQGVIKKVSQTSDSSQAVESI